MRLGETLQTGLVDARERKVRRREAAGRRPRCSERSAREATSTKASATRSIVCSSCSVSLKTKRASSRPSRTSVTHFERVASPRARAVPRAGRLRRETEERRACHDLVELAEVVEDQVRLSVRAEQRRAPPRPQVPQQAVAEPSVAEPA